MSDVVVSDLKVTVVVAGEKIAQFEFFKTHLAPPAWEITAAIYSGDARTAVRACLLACVAELASDSWESFDFNAEGGSEQANQLIMPWRES